MFFETLHKIGCKSIAVYENAIIGLNKFYALGKSSTFKVKNNFVVSIKIFLRQHLDNLLLNKLECKKIANTILFT